MRGLSRRAILILAASTGGLAVGRPIAVAQQTRPASSKRVALGGYDPVSYFDPGRPEKGSPQFSFGFDDAVYWFNSAEHRAKFAGDPERYAPQYSGYCAMTLAAGTVAEADPESWSVVNGKLYVFGAKEGVQKFSSNSSVIIEQADSNWEKMNKSK